MRIVRYLAYVLHRVLTRILIRTEPIRCTGVSASWCPRCGDCTCRNVDESRDDEDCPLHSATSRHAELEEAA